MSTVSLIRLFFSLPTACSKRLEVVKLYKSITTGVSQCHNTGNEKQSSGKFIFMTQKTSDIICLYDMLKTVIQFPFTKFIQVNFVFASINHIAGGWYSYVCKHRCIYGSKLLFLGESVRDAGKISRLFSIMDFRIFFCS